MSSSPGEQRLEILALSGHEPSLNALTCSLRTAGCGVETVTSLIELRRAFFRAGGHDVLVLGPDLPAAVATHAARSLRSLDKHMLIVAFGDLPRDVLPTDVVRLQAHHPAAPSATTAVLRAIATRA